MDNPWSKTRYRKLVRKLIDRERLDKYLRRDGLRVTSTHCHYPFNYPCSVKNEYDPKKAKEMVKDMDEKIVLPIDITYDLDTFARTVMEPALKELKLNIKFNTLYPEEMHEYIVNGDSPCYFSTIISYRDPMEFLISHFCGKRDGFTGKQNYCNYKNKKMDKKISNICRGSEGDRRKVAYELLRDLEKECVMIPIYSVERTVLVKEDLEMKNYSRWNEFDKL